MNDLFSSPTGTVLSAEADPFDLNLSHSESLLDGALLYFPSAFPGADILYERLLNEIQWETGEVILFGQRHREPRLKSWQGEPGLSYRYSGTEQTTRPLTPTTLKLMQMLNQMLPHSFNSVLCNLYRNGQDSMGWHADDEPELGPGPVIASVTLGAERDFCLRKKGETRQHAKLKLASGSLLIMQAGMQSNWQHAVPKRAGHYQPRINLTFRRLMVGSG